MNGSVNLIGVSDNQPVRRQAEIVNELTDELNLIS